MTTAPPARMELAALSIMLLNDDNCTPRHLLDYGFGPAAVRRHGRAATAAARRTLEAARAHSPRRSEPEPLDNSAEPRRRRRQRRVVRRACLNCRVEFISTHWGERICGPCKKSATFTQAAMDDEPHSIAR